MQIPVHDWQFWVATGIFLVAAAWLFRGVLPIPYLTKRHKAAKQTKRVTLTVGGKAAGEGKEAGCERCGE